MPDSRSYDRAPADIRPVEIEPGFVRTADGSALISIGETKVICTASVTGDVPRWMAGRGKGWVTAEYAMLPASTGDRKKRDRGKQDGRGVEIQRLIGRSLRGVVDFAGIVGGRALCDLDYPEDSTAEVDANVVMTGDGGLVEVQATAERTPLSRASLDELVGLAEAGIERLREVQAKAVGTLPGAAPGA